MNIKNYIKSVYNDEYQNSDIKKIDYLDLVATTAMLYTDDIDIINSCYLCDILVDRKITTTKLKELFDTNVYNIINEITPLQYIDDIMTPCDYKENQLLHVSKNGLFVMLCVIHANIQIIETAKKEEKEFYITCINKILLSLPKKRIVDNKCYSIIKTILQLLNTKYL